MVFLQSKTILSFIVYMLPLQLDRDSLFILILMQTAERDKANMHLFGILCGLALYNDSIVHLPFPLVLFKKLLDAEPTLEDMKEFSPAIGR